MDLATILGIVLGVASVVGAMIFKHIDFGVLVNPAAIFVIFVGTIATILNSFTLSELKNIGALFGTVIGGSKYNDKSAEKTIDMLTEFATEVKKDGVLALEPKVDGMEDPFIRKGMRMLVDGMNEDYILDVLSAEIEGIEERHATNASIFSSAGMYAPTLGVLGAVFGLIAAMSSINDTDKMAEAIAAAFIATILGIFTGYVLWNPFATKLKVKSKAEILEKRIIVEGILSIQKGESPILIRDKLMAFMPASVQKSMSKGQ